MSETTGRLAVGRHLRRCITPRAIDGMSIPCGFGEGNMPVGLQLLGNYFAEAKLLNAAHRFQQATDFHLRKPEGF